MENKNTPQMTMEESLKALEKYLDTDESKQYFENLRIQEELRVKRVDALKKYLDSHDIHVFMERMVNDHDETYIEACYLNCVQPYPKNLLELMFDVAEKYGKPSRKTFGDKYFSPTVHKYGDFYFSVTHGQGVAYGVFYKNKCIISLA